MSEEILKKVARSVEDFTIDFHKLVAGKIKGNFVSSALSAHVVLSMAAYGARGKTAEEMRKALHLLETDSEAYQGIQNFIDSSNEVQKVILKIANKIFLSHNIEVKEEFKKLTRTYFRSESELLDITKPIESAKNVNQWCIDKTNGKIKEILTPNDITPDLAMVLLNAVYFKGNWKDKFDAERTEMLPFHIDSKTTIQVPTMQITKKFKYRELPELNAQCVLLPYENEDVVMEIIVPKEIDGLEKIENNLEKIRADDENNRYYSNEVILSLPKFKVESKINLNAHLKELGMNDMFSGTANFNGISDQSLSVDKVLQKAFIEVNEEGCEAAAVTGMRLMKRSLPLPPLIIKVDKPFLYRIIDKNQNVTLFAGRIVDPKAE